MIHCVVAPFDHAYEENVVLLHNCGVVFKQALVGPVTETVGLVFTVIVCESDAVHPFASVIVTVYVPVVDGLIHCVVAPVDHR